MKNAGGRVWSLGFLGFEFYDLGFWGVEFEFHGFRVPDDISLYKSANHLYTQDDP